MGLRHAVELEVDKPHGNQSSANAQVRIAKCKQTMTRQQMKGRDRSQFAPTLAQSKLRGIRDRSLWLRFAAEFSKGFFGFVAR
jgi:hypothetical protein